MRIDGIPWSRPVIFFPNVILLALSYAWYFAIRRRKRKRET
jgi:hypothetical protein